MTMKTAPPLEEQIDRREVGHQEIEIDIEALFDDLGCDDEGTVRTNRLGRRPEVGHYPPLDVVPLTSTCSRH